MEIGIIRSPFKVSFFCSSKNNVVANILNTIGRNKLVRFLNANVYKSLKLFISELLLDILKARSTANIPKIAVRIKIPKTVLFKVVYRRIRELTRAKSSLIPNGFVK